MTSHVTTHVLDAVSGAPAVGVGLVLSRRAVSDADADAGLVPVATGVTDADGRNRVLGPERLEPGTYRLVFATGAYFAAQGVATFYPEVLVDFVLEPDREHVHVPILLSPFAYSTYRGS
ncbi:hydroxyisourate hydrolase [Cellulomonas fimi]|uniref:5-hydroxyisourate hydrolase n=1 Tax=Cellulomonas fimi TaxID=1708 RepID=A0A7Y0LYT1_CELFI|nr:hydroxyisourate hydrolase [Cellulomonas fimi]NMR20681.1 hydroxyisourate hydrolase [Cellulomonas fimi]